MPAPVLKSQSNLADVKGRSDVAGETDRSDSADTDLFGKYKRKRCTLETDDPAPEPVPVRIKWSRKEETETMLALKDAQDTIKRLCKITESQAEDIKRLSNKKRSRGSKAPSISTDEEPTERIRYRRNRKSSDLAEDETDDAAADKDKDDSSRCAPKASSSDDNTDDKSSRAVADGSHSTFDVAEVTQMRKVGNRIFGTYNCAATGGLIT